MRASRAPTAVFFVNRYMVARIYLDTLRNRYRPTLNIYIIIIIITILARPPIQRYVEPSSGAVLIFRTTCIGVTRF